MQVPSDGMLVWSMEKRSLVNIVTRNVMTQSYIIKRAYSISLIEENVCSDLKLRFIKGGFFSNLILG
jgi:hypothetical protein